MVMHADGDSFFVGCELSRRPDLRGKPVVTGGERGIATAMSMEAKALGVTRGYPVFKLRKDFPQVIVLPGDYELYENYARRMYSVARRFSSRVEEYSVDECFAQLTDTDDCRAVGMDFKRELQRELGMTFSVSVAPTKVLAKLASKRDKPNGFVYVAPERIAQELYHMNLAGVWGIGPSSLARLNLLGLKTVGDLAICDLAWVKAYFDLPIENIWRELLGEIVWPVGLGDVSKHKSLSKTRTFNPATGDAVLLLSQLAKNIENVFGYARSLGLVALEAELFIKNSDYRYRVYKCKFLSPTSTPEALVAIARKELPEMIRAGEKYRTTGVTLYNTRTYTSPQADLFGSEIAEEKRRGAHKVADLLYHKYDARVLALASSMSARDRVGELSSSLPLPHLGEVN